MSWRFPFGVQRLRMVVIRPLRRLQWGEQKECICELSWQHWCW